jgi:hypothetical protein
MSDEIGKLEELVAQTVVRLNDLRRERAALREEIDGLKARLAAAPDGQGAARRTQAIQLLRSALGDLRAS